MHGPPRNAISSSESGRRAPPEPVAHPRRFPPLVLLVTSIEQTIINVALPQLVDGLKASDTVEPEQLRHCPPLHCSS